MDEQRLKQFLDRSMCSNKQAIEYIAGNFIDIGGSMVGLTVDNAINAIEFALEYNKQRSLTDDVPEKSAVSENNNE